MYDRISLYIESVFAFCLFLIIIEININIYFTESYAASGIEMLTVLYTLNQTHHLRGRGIATGGIFPGPVVNSTYSRHILKV